MVEMSMKTVGPGRSAGILQQNRVFLDFFWDLAKPEQEVRLKAIEDLIQYLKTNNKVSQRRHTKFCNTFLYMQSTNYSAMSSKYFLYKCPVAAVLFVCCILYQN